MKKEAACHFFFFSFKCPLESSVCPLRIGLKGIFFRVKHVYKPSLFIKTYTRKSDFDSWKNMVKLFSIIRNCTFKISGHALWLSLSFSQKYRCHSHCYKILRRRGDGEYHISDFLNSRVKLNEMHIYIRFSTGMCIWYCTQVTVRACLPLVENLQWTAVRKALYIHHVEQ